MMYLSNLKRDIVRNEATTEMASSIESVISRRFRGHRRREFADPTDGEQRVALRPIMPTELLTTAHCVPPTHDSKSCKHS